jgi:dihydroxycyclohexadiene carboxylate dehydrogenase
VRRSLFPTLWCCRAVLPYMLEQARASIVNVSSIATRGVNRVPYGAAKGGVNALTACLAMETAARHPRQRHRARRHRSPAAPRPAQHRRAERAGKALVPADLHQSIDSSLMKRYGTLDEQADPILFLASDESAYITGTVGGGDLPVGGGDLG